MLLLWIIYVISVLFLLCFHACLFIDALWSPAGKGLTVLDLDLISFGSLGPRASLKVEYYVNFTESRKV